MIDKPKITKLFPYPLTGSAMNYIFEPIRQGTTDPYFIIEIIREKIETRKNRYNYISPTEELLLRLLNGDSFKNYLPEAIEYCIAWDKQTVEEKDKSKKEASMKYREPTLKQINFIKSRGIKTIPKNRLEASNIISILLKKK